MFVVDAAAARHPAVYHKTSPSPSDAGHELTGFIASIRAYVERGSVEVKGA